jgi:hypothetical protein
VQAKVAPRADFYEYNLEWQNRVNLKNERIRTENTERERLELQES